MIEHVRLDIIVEVEDRELRRRNPDRAVVAQCAALTIGFAAYDAALIRHPRDRVMLRHGARVIRDTHPEPNEDYPGR